MEQEAAPGLALRLSLLPIVPVSGVTFETFQNGWEVGQGSRGRGCSISWSQGRRQSSAFLAPWKPDPLSTSNVSNISLVEAALGPRQLPLEEAQHHRAHCSHPPGPYPIGAYRCPACLHNPRRARVFLRPSGCISRAFWAGPKEDPVGPEAEGKQPLLCNHPLDPEPLLSHPALGRRALSRRSPLPAPPQHPSFPAQHHPSPSPQSEECASGHCGTCSQSLLAHFTRAFTNWPASHGCCLGFGSKEADRGGPSSPQFLMLYFAPTPEEAVSRRVKEPWGGAGSPQTPALLRHPALWRCLPMLGPRLQAIHLLSQPS